MAEGKFLKVPEWLKDFLADPFQRWLAVGLVLVALVMTFQEYRPKQQTTTEGRQISFFFHPQCPHCREQKKFIPYLQAKYPELPWISYDTSQQENVKLMTSLLAERGQPTGDLGVPMTFIGPYVISGFKTAETTGSRIEMAIRAYVNDDPSLYPEEERRGHGEQDSVDLPFVGKIKVADYSLPALAIIIGLVDGFNPCAMWVLVYLISLILCINDRRKVWLLVGTFVLASGILYFLFMTAWLNVFLYMGYLRTVTLLVGLVALGAGIISVREFIRDKGQVTCKIGDADSKKRTMGRIERIVNSPLTFFSVFSIIVLAFIINSIEFACSAALPAIFTHALSLRNLPTIEYYGYILLYDLFFMLDDLVIFSLAVLALDTSIGMRYAGYCKIIGGTVLIGLGSVMAFWPELLR